MERTKTDTHRKIIGEVFFLGSREAPSKARSQIRDWLGPDHPIINDVLLVVSELVTNAVIHADHRQADDRIGLALIIDDHFLGVKVSDPGAAFTAPHIPEEQSWMTERGRGLKLVNQCSGGRWGTYKRPQGSGRIV